MDNSNTLPRGSAAVPAKERTTSSRIKSIFSGSVGNMVEWYDWYVYAAFSLYFAKTFFPKGDTTRTPAEHRRDLRRGLPDASDRRVADGPVRRQGRTQESPDGLGVPDVLRFAADCA